MTRINLTEARPVAEATPVEGQPGRFLVQLITPGWGSSGYYAPAVLEAAAKANVFASGTHMYLDHPTESENYERPERSVRDLAAVLSENARWDGNALVAEATVFGPYREVLSQMAESIGVSIRAAAEVSDGGEAEGRTGRIIDELVEGGSVDFVTHAGRGGRIVAVLESARQIAEARSIGQWLESRLHRDFTITADDMAGDGRLTREERISLSSAIGDALAAFVARIEADQPQLYSRDLWADPQDTVAAATEGRSPEVIDAVLQRLLEAAPLQIDSTRGREVGAWLNEAGHSLPTDDPVTRPGSTTPTQSQEDTMPQIEESRLRELEEASGRVPTLESERDTARQERDTARADLAQERRTNRASEIVREADAQFTPLETRGLLAGLPVTESGDLDEAAFTTTVNEAVAAAKEARGDGAVKGFGGGSTPTTGVSEADFNAALGIKIGA